MGEDGKVRKIWVRMGGEEDMGEDGKVQKIWVRMGRCRRYG